jgi:hypothetical protein
MNYREIFQSKKFKIALLGIAGLIAALLIFQAGIFVGYRKADFSFNWERNYPRVFGTPPNNFFNEFGDRGFINGHGTVGQIIKIDGYNIIIKGSDNVEKTIIVSDSTSIQSGRQSLKISDLKINDYIVAIGSPNNSGQIDAKFIRVMPPPNEVPPISPSSSHTN